MQPIEMIDLRGPDVVEIKIDRVSSGWALWVNVDGACKLRIYKLPDDTIIEDHRNEHATD